MPGNTVQDGRGERGQAAESAACHFLQHKGLELLERNYRTEFGELDLVMLDGKVLAFVEVRLRNRDSHGGGAASVTPAKQRRIARAAALYLQRRDKNCGCRFDVMEVRQLAAGRFSMRWIRNAFETPAAAF